jgi:hypothetical protein
MSLDASALVSKVIERALEKFALSQTGAPAEPPKDVSPEAVLVDSLAGQLLGFVTGANSSRPDTEQLGAVIADLQQKNRRLARALGACDCWGEIAACPQCAGRGGAGYQLPEREAFETVVRPALNRVSAYRLAAQGGNVRRL